MATKNWTLHELDAHARVWARRTCEGRSNRAMGIVPSWIETREIRLMWEEGVSLATVQAVENAIRALITRVGMRQTFSIVHIGSGWDTGRGHVRVIDYIGDTLKAGEVDEKALFRLSYHEHYRRQRQHADVYITRRALQGDPVSWGAAMFEYGCMVLALYGDRQHNPFLHRLVRHEAGHLLGLPMHCDDYRIDRFAYDAQCNMHGNVPHMRTCNKCLRFLRLWWETIG